ncbi:MAG TPA: hypothetical protein VFM94_04215 [Solirubrobacterales bacterium]|nr:hypothetical protein [Solirubrobacterales bacterium]
MIRNLKAMVLAVTALCAVGAMVAPAAPADQLTSDGSVTITGKDSSKSTFTGFGLSASCQGEYTVGLENQTPHTYFDPSILFVARFTVAPHYTKCDSTSGESQLSSTLTMNGCDYLVEIGNGTESWEVVCPEGQQIEMHSYSSSSHSLSLCTVSIPDQSGISGGDVENVKEGGVEKLTVKESLSSINATRSGLCGSGGTESAAMDLHVVISGVNKKGEPTGISITP